MLGGLFAGMGGGGGGGGSNLGSGADVTNINGGGEKSAFVSAATLPSSTSAGEVTSAASRCGHLEAQAFLLNRLSKWRLGQADAALNILQTRLDHSQQMMQKEVEYQRAFGKHGKALLRYGLGVAENKANVTAYEASFGSAMNSLNF